jgi:predicted  nucleic acid-binding Zn-ribbon protein
MTSPKELFSLQELDLALDQIDSKTAKAKKEVSIGAAMGGLEEALQKESQSLEEFQSLMKTRRVEAETQRERSTHLDGQLYGGEVTSPSALESLEQEAANVRAQMEKLDLELTELSSRTEESQNKCTEMEQRLSENRTAWESRQSELTESLNRLSLERKDIASQRGDLVATLDPAGVQHYEKLRNAKGGLAVAKVSRGLCQACRMALPTQQQQSVRNGRQTVLCSTCGRILFLT